MSAVLHHVLLALSILALAQAAIRVADRLAPRGLERIIAAAVLGVTFAVIETLALGLVGLGSSTFAVSGAAALTWAVAILALPAPEVRVAEELGVWWQGLGSPWRVATAALAGGAAVWVAWLLLHPAIGFDASVYHYPEIAGWISNGHPGSILPLSYEFPFGNYPLTDEVALTWAAGIARSFVPLSLWGPAMLLLLAGAGWLTLRNLAVPRLPAALGMVALVTAPIAIRQLSVMETDLPALTWLACPAALCTGVRRAPPLMACALLAGGLAIGTKPTPAIMVVGAVGVAAYHSREALRPLALWLILALVGAFTVGGFWYARNLVQHGSPFWPYATAPWGSPRPSILQLTDTSFLQRPGATFDAIRSFYSSQLAGGIVLLGAAPLVLLIGALAPRSAPTTRRHLIAAGGLVVVGFLAWSLAAGTGLPRAHELFEALGWPISTLRYLLPTIGAATVALALAAREGGAIGALSTLVLAGAVVWDMVVDAGLGAPYLPSLRTIALGAVGGMLLLGLAFLAWRSGLSRARAAGRVPGAWVLCCAGALAGVVVAPASNGYLKRYATVKNSTALEQDIVAWFASQRDLANGHQPVAFASRTMLAALSGDHFTHRLELIPASASCARVRALNRLSVVVVSDPRILYGFLGILPYQPGRQCLAGLRPAFQDSAFSVYRPG